MYEEFYNLTERPFSLSPDPSFLYFGNTHLKAMNILEYGIASDAGITVVSGEVGTGKTTLIRHLIEKLDQHVKVGLITNTQHNFGDLLKWVLLSYDIKTDETDRVKLYQLFVDFLSEQHQQGNRIILIIDEAQNLNAAALEDIRMMTNINVDKRLVLQLVLVGQPELINLLKKKELRQFAQRVSADYFIEPLNYKETKEYIKHRLKVVGCDHDLFAPTAYATIYYHSGGIPRVINTICDMSLVYGYADELPLIRKEVVLDAIRDRKVGGLSVRDDLGENEVAEKLREEIMRKTGIDIAEI